MIGGIDRIDACTQPTFGPNPLEMRQEIGSDERQGPGRLRREQAQQPVGLGLEHPLEQLVFDDCAASTCNPAIEQLDEVPGIVEVVGQSDEELTELPRNRLA